MGKLQQPILFVTIVLPDSTFITSVLFFSKSLVTFLWVLCSIGLWKHAEWSKSHGIKWVLRIVSQWEISLKSSVKSIVVFLKGKWTENLQTILCYYPVLLVFWWFSESQILERTTLEPLYTLYTSNNIHLKHVLPGIIHPSIGITTLDIATNCSWLKYSW